MTSEKQLSIVDYRMKKIDESREPLGKDIYVYSMDGYPDKNRGGCHDMARHVGLPCHCCDCVIFMEDAICLIEETESLRIQDDVDSLLSEFQNLKIQGNQGRRQKKIEYALNNLNIELVAKYIIQDNILKIYGSMLVLYKLSHYCEIIKKRNCFYNKKENEFWLVLPSHEEKDAGSIDLIMRELKKQKMKNKLNSVTSGFFKDVKFLFKKDIEKKIRESAAKSVSG